MAGQPTGEQSGRPSKPTGFRNRLKAALRGTKKEEVKPATLSPEEVRQMEQLAGLLAGPSPRDSSASLNTQAAGGSEVTTYDRSALPVPLQFAAWNGFPVDSMNPAAGPGNPTTQAARSPAVAGPPPGMKQPHGGSRPKGKKLG